jgi:hypothetical protein
MMIVGRWFDDDTVHRGAAAFEALTDRDIYVPKR